MCVLSRFSHARLSVTPWTVCSPQAPLSTGFSRREYWSGLSCPPPEDPPDPGPEPALQADSLPLEPPGKPQEDTSSYRMIGPWVEQALKMAESSV